jgi:hypothetical protein
MSILETTFICNGTPITVSTVQNEGESIADFAARHRQRVADAEEHCEADPLPPNAIQTTWKAALGTMNFSSTRAYGKARHDADAKLLKEKFPVRSDL